MGKLREEIGIQLDTDNDTFGSMVAEMAVQLEKAKEKLDTDINNFKEEIMYDMVKVQQDLQSMRQVLEAPQRLNSEEESFQSLSSPR